MGVDVMTVNHYKNRELRNMPGEEWMDILGYDGYYSISNMGRVKSEHRIICTKNGWEYTIKERILKQNVNSKSGQVHVDLCVGGVSKSFAVPVLVGEAFLGQRKDGEVYCHANMNMTDNRLKNIHISTKYELSMSVLERSYKGSRPRFVINGRGFYSAQALARYLKEKYDIPITTTEHRTTKLKWVDDKLKTAKRRQ